MSWGLGVDIPMSFETRVRAHEYAESVDVPVVRSSDEAWEALANASEQFRSALNSARQDLAHVATTNYFGECVEGHTMHDRVLRVIVGDHHSIVSQIANQASYLEDHASTCRAAGSRLTASDAASFGA